MKSVRLFALGVLLIASMIWPAPGCSDPAISLQHLLADKDCESASELLGDWQAGSDLSGIWTIQKFGDRKYRLIQKVGESDTSNKEAFDICVAHLGGYLFFDATFQTVGPDGKTILGDDDNFFWIPLHLIGRLDIVGDALHFRLLEDGWLQDELKSGRLHLTCSQDDEGGYLLTAPSKELKQFAARFAADLKAFSYTEDFDRVPREEAIRRSHTHFHGRRFRETRFRGNVSAGLRELILDRLADRYYIDHKIDVLLVKRWRFIFEAVSEPEGCSLR